MKALALTVLLLPAAAGAQTLEFRVHDPDAPAATVDGSIRGAEGDLSIELLAPPRLALTASDHPALYWFASDDINWPVEIVVVAEGGTEPLVEARMEPPIAAGVHRYELPESATLAPGYYQWSVAAVADEDSRSNDVFASALLQRVAETPTDLSDDMVQRASQLAARGIWYDTLDLLAQATADSQTAARLRRELLEQAGLQQYADANWRNTP